MHVMHSQIEILGAFIDKVTLDEAVQHTHEFIESGLSHQIVTVNVDFIRLAQENSEFMHIINGSALAIADASRYSSSSVRSCPGVVLRGLP